MTYVFRDPVRMRKVPVHVPLPDPEPLPTEPTSPELPEIAGSVWGGSFGLALAAAESAALDHRTEILIRAGAASEWITEYKRYRNIK
jgi:hypothetical protein